MPQVDPLRGQDASLGLGGGGAGDNGGSSGRCPAPCRSPWPPGSPYPVDVLAQDQAPAHELVRGLLALLDPAQEAAEGLVVLLGALQHLTHHVLRARGGEDGGDGAAPPAPCEIGVRFPFPEADLQHPGVLLDLRDAGQEGELRHQQDHLHLGL